MQDAVDFLHRFFVLQRELDGRRGVRRSLRNRGIGDVLLLAALREVGVFRDLTEPHAHIAVALEAVDCLHRAEEGLLCQLLGEIVAAGERAEIAVNVVEILSVKRLDHGLLTSFLPIRRTKGRNLTKKNFFQIR